LAGARRRRACLQYRPPGRRSSPNGTTTLANARAKLAEALEIIDQAIIADRDAHAAQQEMRHIAADANNPQTKSKYATYAALDAKVRPIYSKHGFSLSFYTADGAPEGSIRIVCKVARGGHTERPYIDMPADGKGAKGGDVMTKTHATGAGVTYGRRYLLGMIFNLVIGEDNDGNGASDTGERITLEQAENWSRSAMRSAPTRGILPILQDRRHCRHCPEGFSARRRRPEQEKGREMTEEIIQGSTNGTPAARQGDGLPRR
jgi:hypothetical protein